MWRLCLLLLAALALAPTARAATDAQLAATGAGMDACGAPVSFTLRGSGSASWNLNLVVVQDLRSNFNCGGLVVHQASFHGAWADTGPACFTSGADTLCIEQPFAARSTEAGTWTLDYTSGSYHATGFASGIGVVASG